jgi:hypothetical protein
LASRDRLRGARSSGGEAKAAFGRRSYVSVDDRTGNAGWFPGGSQGNASSCPGRDRFGFGADILSRVADLSNPAGEGASARCPSPEWCNDAAFSTNDIGVHRRSRWLSEQR